MADKRKTQERVQNDLSLFSDELGIMNEENTSTKKARKSYSSDSRRGRTCIGYTHRKRVNRSGDQADSRKRQNSKMWANLYPSPKR